MTPVGSDAVIASGRPALRLGLAVVVAVLIADQATKAWIVDGVMDPPRVIPVTSFFNLVMVWNRGVSFGMFGDAAPYGPWILIGVALAVATGLGIWLWRTSDRLLAVALGLIIGGAVGNVIDRVRYGAVADFLDFHVAGFHWPAFNVADSAISVGAVLIAVDALLLRRGER